MTILVTKNHIIALHEVVAAKLATDEKDWNGKPVFYINFIFKTNNLFVYFDSAEETQAEFDKLKKACEEVQK